MPNAPPPTQAPDPPHAAQKYAVTVVTTGPSSKPLDAAENQQLRPIIKKAFAELEIDTPLEEFTFENEAGEPVTLDTKVGKACATTDCRIFALPIKVEDA